MENQPSTVYPPYISILSYNSDTMYKVYQRIPCTCTVVHSPFPTRVLLEVYYPELSVRVPAENVTVVAGPEIHRRRAVSAQYDHLARFPASLDGGQSGHGLFYGV